VSYLQLSKSKTFGKRPLGSDFEGFFFYLGVENMATQDARVPMTNRGYQLLAEELKRLKSVERPKNVREIEEARGHGDLSENAEFHAAKERQSLLDVQIRDIEDKLARAQVIEVSKLSGDKVVFGATVSLADGDTGDKMVYQIVGDHEAEPKNGKISISSPVARALIGKSEGDEVQVRTPTGVRSLEILGVEYID
jgi:transcription elongation factor GreA